MVKQFILLIIVIGSLLLIGTCQTVPFYGASNNFYINEAKAVAASGNYSFSLPATFPISTLVYRQPFYAFNSVSNIKTVNNQAGFFWTTLTGWSASVMNVTIYCWVVTVSGTKTYYGFEAGSYLTFRYMLVRNTFPNKYMCYSTLYTGVSWTLAAGASKTNTISLLSTVNPAPIALNSTDTVFIYSFSDGNYNTTKTPYNNTFELTLSFNVINATAFNAKVTANMFPIILFQIEFKVFIYNKADFSALYVSIDYQQFSYSGLAVGTSSTVVQSYTAVYAPALTTSILFGIQGFQLSGYVNSGFTFFISQVNGTSYTITLQNLWATSTIPRLDLLVVLPSQFQCPFNELIIDSTLTICYNTTTCPTSTYNSTTVLGITGIYVCNPCNINCLNCSITANNCTACNSSMYLTAGKTCANCTTTYGVNCATCNSTICITCIQGYGLATNGLSCKLCSTYSSQCLTCTELVCLTCNESYILNSNASTCIQCTFYDPNCTTCNSTVCTACSSGYGLATNGLLCVKCSSYSSQCLTCTGSLCSSCSSGYILDAKNSTCIACTTFDPNCVSCTASACTSCNSASGYVLNTATNLCSTCPNLFPNCLTCTSSSCTACNTATGYYLNPNTLLCVNCSSYSPQCTTCDGLNCLSCSVGYFLDSTGNCSSCQPFDKNCATCNSTICLSCTTGFYLASNGTCQSCSIYGQQCTVCNQTSCTNCSKGYGVVQTKCQLINPVCGDGIWIYPQQACNDGNIVNGDGCSSTCQVEPDYECLIADQLPSGASLCKFTQNLTVNLDSVQKDITSNQLQVYLTLGPSTFKQWTQQEILNLLSPIQIVDSKTGNVTTIPVSNLTMTYNQDAVTGQVELLINYGNNNLEGSYIHFNVVPSQTGLSALKNTPIQNNVMVPLNSTGCGFYIYDYPSSAYETQNLVRILSEVVGLISLLFAVLGFLIPSGKLIVLEGLAVVQVGYFSLLQFDKIPPTFSGLQSLNPCNGFNNLGFFASQSQLKQNIFKIIGLKITALTNDNISLVMFVFLPMIVGAIGFLITRKSANGDYKMLKKDSIAEEIKNEETTKLSAKISVEQSQQPTMGRVIFERILFENTFYGLLFGGYLGWVSILHSFTQPTLFDYAFIGIVAISMIGYGFLYVRSESKEIPVKSSADDKNAKRNLQVKILTQFGQFAQVHQQLMPGAESMLLKRFYLFFMVERLLNSSVLVFMPDMMKFTSPILVGIYVVQLVAMIVLYKKLQTDESTKEKSPMFSYLYQNYVLRQGINFLTIILIQGMYFSVTVIVQSQGPYEAFVNNKLVTTGVPYAILSLLLLNLGFNVFCWVWELKSDNILTKAKFLIGSIFPSLSKSSSELNSSKQEEDEMNQIMNEFMKTSSLFKTKENPFLGLQQKESSRNTLLNLLKAETKISLPQIAQNMKSEMINQMWDQI